MSTSPTAKHAKPMISNEAYDFLKWVAGIVLPALGALYFGLAQIWGLPNAEEVVGTVTVVDLFLGTILGLSTKQYNQSEEKYDGQLVVDTSDEGKDVYSFEVTSTPLEDLRNKQELTFKVQKSV